MPTPTIVPIPRLARLLAVVVLIAGAIGVSPATLPAQAAPPVVAPARPANLLLPSPVPTILVTTATVANDPNDGQCDLWEAMQAAFQATVALSPTYHECTALVNNPNVIGFSGAAAGGTLEIPDTLAVGGELPFAAGDLTLLGPVTIKPSATNTDTHTLVMGVDATLTLIAVTLSGGHTSGGGAAILDFNHSTVNLIGSNVTGNVADNDGGAINSNGNVNVTLTNFSGNEALGVQPGAGLGGAIAFEGSGSLAVSKSNFAGNTARLGGGAIYSLSQNATIEDSLFSGNIGGQGNDPDNAGGGAIYNAGNGLMAIARTQFAGNLAPQGNGGGVFNTGATLLITDTTFAANLAGDFSHATLGGGLYDRTLLTVYRSSFANNISVKGDGGGLAVDRHGTVDVANTTFVANGAPYGAGGGIVITQTQTGGPASTFTARNVTIANNASSSGQGGGIFDGPGQNLTLGNTLLANNIGLECGGGGNLDNLGHNLDSGTSCNIGNSNGNLSNGSANLGGPSFNGGPIASMLTLKLQVPSDAIDHGDAAICAGALVNNEDQRGNKRPVDGTNPGNLNPICDIGAYEADAPSPGFGSAPSEPGPINVGNTQTGTTVTTTLVVSNTGNYFLDLTGLALTGSNSGDFSVSLAPIHINVGDPPVNLVISCTPSQANQRTALLGFATTDKPLHVLVGYQLKCNGYAAPQPGFSSVPIAPGPIVFPDTLAFGGNGYASFKVSETGDAPLHITGMSLSGPNASDFHVLSATSFIINNGGAAQTVTVRCSPAVYGLRSATLTLTTDDPNQLSVTFALTCKGVPPPSPYLLATTSMGNTPDHGIHRVLGVAVSSAGNFVYSTGSDGSGAQGRVTSFSRDPGTGVLQYIHWVHELFGGLDGPGLIALSPDGKNAYAAGQTNGVLVQLTEQPNGEMDITHRYTPAALAGAFGVAVSPDGHNVYATGPGANAVVAFTRTLATGDLNALDFQSTSSVANLGGAEGVAVSPDGQNVYVTGYNSNSVEVLKRNSATGALSHVQTRKQSDTLDGPALTGMTGATRVALSPDGASLYVASYTDSAVVAFSRHPADGKLTWIGTFQCGCGAVNGLNGAFGVDVTPDGTRVIASGYGGAGVVVLDRDLGSGALTFHEELTNSSNSLPLHGASEVRVSPDGHTAYVAANLDDTINVLAIANPVPFISSISPASAPQGGPGFTLHVYGANFMPGSQILGFTTTFVNPNQVDAFIPSGSIANPGQVFVQATNPEPVGSVAFSIPFYVQIIPPADHPIPSIDHITPQGGLAGGNALTMDVFGANFVNGSVVQWNGFGRATTFLNSGHLQAAIPQSDVSQPGTSSVSVVTGVPGGGVSNPIPFTVAQPGQNAVPTLTGINPLWVFSLGAASKQIQLTVTGQNFIQGSLGQIDGVSRPTLFVDSSHLQVTLIGSDLLAPGNAGITVFSPTPGGGASNTLTFVIKKLYRLLIPFVRN